MNYILLLIIIIHAISDILNDYIFNTLIETDKYSL